MSNYYNNLDINEKSDDLSREKEEKKARKILKSIEDLKKRSNLNDDQKRKIDTEYLWRKFLDPSYTTHEEKKQLEKEREREAAVKKKKRDKKRVESERLNKIREEEQIKKDAKLQKEQDKNLMNTVSAATFGTIAKNNVTAVGEPSYTSGAHM